MLKDKIKIHLGKTVHIDGFDNDYLVKKVTLWKNYYKREEGSNGAIKHGKKVLLKSFDEKNLAVYVEKNKKKKGWLHYRFIKELEE